VADHIKQLAAGVDLAEKFNKRCQEEEDVSMICAFLLDYLNKKKTSKKTFIALGQVVQSLIKLTQD